MVNPKKGGKQPKNGGEHHKMGEITPITPVWSKFVLSVCFPPPQFFAFSASFSLFSGLAVITTRMYGKICFRTPKSQPERSPTAPFLRFPSVG